MWGTGAHYIWKGGDVLIFTLAGGILSMAKLEAVDKEKKDGALGEV